MPTLHLLAFPLFLTATVYLTAQPTVSLTSPAPGSNFPLGIPITLTATAQPTSGASVSNVTFYQGASSIGQSTSSPYSIGWTPAAIGQYSLAAQVTDSVNATVSSLPVSVQIIATIPFATDFEAGDGFSVGSIAGQQDWLVNQGAANIVTGAAYTGSQSVNLTPSEPSAQLSTAVANPASASVVYVDFYAQPAADPTVTSSSIITVNGASVGFLKVASSAVLQLLNGNGSGGGTWVSPMQPTSLPLGAGNQTSSWHRFTFREDFGAQTWDFYIDGQMIYYGALFAGMPSSQVLPFSIAGHSTANVGLDKFEVVSSNPLFTNQSNDGIADSWKQANGLDPSQNDRTLSPSGNGIPVILDYVTGATPADYYNGRAVAVSSPVETTSISYSYDAAGRLSAATYGSISQESFSSDTATNLTTLSSVCQPIVTWRSTNGLPLNGTGMGADTAFPAGDNLPNLAKYALGLPAQIAVVGSYPIISLLSQGGLSYLALQYQRPDPAPADLSYNVEVSSDGSNWSSGTGATITVSSASSGGQATVLVQDATPISSPQYGRIIRLHVTRSLVTY